MLSKARAGEIVQAIFCRRRHQRNISISNWQGICGYSNRLWVRGPYVRFRFECSHWSGRAMRWSSRAILPLAPFLLALPVHRRETRD